MDKGFKISESITLTLQEWEAHHLLDAIYAYEAKLRHVNSSSQNEDEVADAGNDLMEVVMVKKHLEAEAVRVFGESIKTRPNKSI